MLIGVGHFEAGWRVTFTANIYTPLDSGVVLLQLCQTATVVVDAPTVRLVTEQFLSLFPKPGTVYLQTSKLLPVQWTLFIKRRLKTWLFYKGIWLIFRLLLLQLFYQYFINVFCYYIIIIIVIIIFIIILSSPMMSCAIGLYMYCGRSNTNDCLQLLLHWKFSHKETFEQTLFDWNLILFTKMTNFVF